jgi:hypothetical protein
MTDNASNVIRLERGRAAHVVLSAPLSQLRDTAQQQLRQSLQSLFDNTDDALFELADRATNNAEQNMFFESMREVRLHRRSIEASMLQLIDDGLRQLQGGALIGEANTNSSAGSDELSLIDHEQMEERLALEAMVNKAEQTCNEFLADLTSRLASLSPRGKLTNTDNPLGPYTLCNAFVDACNPLNAGIKARLVLFKLFDRYVINALPEFYQAANQCLQQAGVMSQRVGKKTVQRRPYNGAAEADKYAAKNSRESSETAEATEEMFESLRNLLASSRPVNTAASTREYGLVERGHAPAMPRQMMFELLQDVQASQNQMQEAVARLDVPNLLSQLMLARQPNTAMSMNQLDEDAINIVSMLFQFILDDRNLADPMKALIARLQIPILKVAMLDKSFFGRGAHPARKLLNQISTAAMGWVPAANLERDFFHRKVEDVVNILLNDFHDDVSIFETVRADFASFLEVENRRSSLVEQRTLDAEEGRARAELARQDVQDVLTARLQGLELPAVVNRLVREGWNNVLFLARLKEGIESEAWQNDLAVLDDLLWSVQAEKTKDNRSRLLKMLPTLLKSLRAGLNSVGTNPYEMNQQFSELEAIHLERLRAPDVVIDAQNEAQLPPEQLPNDGVTSLPIGLAAVSSLDALLSDRQQGQDSLAQLDRELSAEFGDDDLLLDSKSALPMSATVEDLTATTINQPSAEMINHAVTHAAALDAVQQQVSRLALGAWVEMSQADEKKFRARLAAIIKATGRYIFVNRTGMKVAEHTQETLVLAMQSGQLQILDEGQLFDRALESVIGNLRQMRS